MISAGDIIRIKEDAPYTVTKPGSQWLVYGVDGATVRIGTLPLPGKHAADMIRLYGNQNNTLHQRRRWEAGVKLYTIMTDEVRPVGNNLLFKGKLFQGDIWEEPKSKHWDYFNMMGNKRTQPEMVSCFLLEPEDDSLPF